MSSARPLNYDENIESEPMYDTQTNRGKQKNINNVNLTSQGENIDISDISFENNPLDSSDKKKNQLY